jgi:ATP-dependent exoDNAse (exonuclease V) beta subunit
VGTVDSFQGQERAHLFDIRRMYVGMTRARRKLLLVGDSSTLCMHSLPASAALCSQKRRQPDNAWLYRSASSYKQVEKT